MECKSIDMLSLDFFNLCFNSFEQIEINSIKTYKIKTQKDYLKGGFYMIKNKKNQKCYIGKSIDYMARLKQHTYNSNNKLIIDKELKKSLDDFDFFLLIKYKDVGINFFNRKLETIIEHRLINIKNSIIPFGYNNRHYGYI